MKIIDPVAAGSAVFHQERSITIPVLSFQCIPARDEEVNRYFVAPGYDIKEWPTIKQQELSRAKFKKIPDIIVLDLLCKEHIRCEQILVDCLPAIFKVAPVRPHSCSHSSVSI